MRRRRRRSFLAVRWLCSLALPLGARTGQGQSTFRASIDGGAAVLRQTGQSSVTAPTIGGDLRVEGLRAALRGTVGATLAGVERWSAQGDLTGSWFAAEHGPLAWELGGNASALRYNGAPSATSGTALARQHIRIASGGAWIGGGGGILARPRWNTPIGTVEAGGWTQRARLRASLTLAALRARLDTPFVDSLSGQVRAGDPATRPLTALDATALAEWRAPGWELSGIAGFRRAARQHSGIIGTAFVTGAWWVAPRTAFTASLGALAADPLRALPGRRIATVGLRWRPAGSPAVPLGRVERATATPAVTIVRREGGAVLRVRAPGATQVELRGDWTAWRAAALAAVGDVWELATPLPSGTQRLTLRIDGGAWQPPANLPTVADDFGERVGLLVVP